MFLSRCVVIFTILLITLFSSTKAQNIETPTQYKNMQAVNLGSTINTKLNDYAFWMTKDGKNCVLTSNRTTIEKDDEDDDIWYSSRADSIWGSVASIGSELNSSAYWEVGGDGTPSITGDGQQLFFASAKDGGIGNVDLYSAKLINGKWSDPQNLGPIVNSKYFDSHPCISIDGKTLYFASDRSGGYGGVDIWVTTKDDKGNWTEPKNLGPIINTEDDESSPFIASDKVNLFFSSNRPNGFGKHDIYKSQLSGSGWTTPQNLGTPINSEYNDRFPFVPSTGNSVYFSSDRFGGIGGYDIYVTVPIVVPPKLITTISGIISDAQTRSPIKATIEFKDVESGKAIAYYECKENGEYVIVISKGDKFDITVKSEGYITHQERYEIPKEDLYKEIKKNFKLTKIKSKMNITASHILSTADFVKRIPTLANFMGLVIEEVKTTESLPLLNYLFFDKESATLAKKYKLFNSPSDTIGFDESKVLGGSLIQYYNILNIIGSRLKKIPKARITLVGCNDNDAGEAKNIQLSKQRAEAIRDYLQNIWGISKDRMRVTAQNLPDVVSPTGSPEGQAENRRVEIQTSNWEIIKPVTFTQNEYIPSPNELTLNVKVTSDDPISNWQLALSHSGRKLKKFTEDKAGTFTKNWDWKDESGKYVASEKPIVYEAFSVSKNRDTVFTDPVQIPVKIVDRRSKQIDRVREIEIEKISLILFEFKKFEISAQNQKVMNMVYDRILPNSTIGIFGYTDDIGSEDYNRDLSNKRAKSVNDILHKEKPQNKMSYEGVGEDKPIYSNLLPEGRFYNRTVQIILEREVK